MLRIRLSVVPLFLATALAAPLAAQQKAPAGRMPQDLLPASTHLAVGFGGLERCGQAVADHAAAQVVLEFLRRVPKQTFEQHIGAPMATAVDQVRAALAEGGVSPATLRSVLRRPMALGMGRLTIRGFGPSIALVIDAGDAAASIDALVQTCLGILQQQDSGFQVLDGTVAGVAGRKLVHAQGPTIWFVHAGSTFVATNSEGYLQEILATQNGRQPSLATASSLGRQRQGLGAAPLFEVFANTGPLLAVAEPLLPYEATAIGAALGVQSLDGIHAGIAQAGDGTIEAFDIGLRGPSSGLLKAQMSGQADFGAARFFSADTIAFATLRCDLPALEPAFAALLETMPEPAQREMARELGRELRRELRRLGTTPEAAKELLSALGGAVTAGVSMAKGVPVPEVLFAVPIRNRQVIAAWLERATTAVAQHGIEWKTREADAVTIRYCDIGNGQIPFKVSPAFALLDDYLLIASDPRVLMAAQKQRAGGEGGLAEAEDFAAAAAANPHASAFLHVRQGRGLELGWRLLDNYALKPLDAQQEELGFGRDALPEPEDLARGAGATTLVLTIDEQGVRMTAKGNLLLGGLLVGGGALLDELLQRAAGKIY